MITPPPLPLVVPGEIVFSDADEMIVLEKDSPCREFSNDIIRNCVTTKMTHSFLILLLVTRKKDKNTMEMTTSFLDSILPGFSGSIENGSRREKRICVPGEQLFSVSDGYHAGNGCYEFLGSICASLTGFVHIYSLNDSQNTETNIVEVRRNIDERSHVLPSQGKIVTARVERITTMFAKCAIICVEDTSLVNEFNSTLRKEDVRDKERDKVELHKFVQPGDIILARVLGYGEAHTSYLLTIAEPELGVVIGRSQNGERLLPENLELMKVPGSEYREIRKVAQLPIVNK